MLTTNNWLTTNVKAKSQNRNLDFDVTTNLYPFKKMSFDDASIFAAKKIQSDFQLPFFLGLSGGADSEYVLKVFHKLDIPMTPIIVECYGNRFEILYAYRICRELNIEPIIIKVTQKEIIKYFYNIIHKKFNLYAIDTIYSLIAAQEAKKLGGVFITGENPIVNEESNQKTFDEFEFYPDLLDIEYLSFYYYTLELFFSLITNTQKDEITADFKHRMYQNIWRPKLYSVHSKETVDLYHNIIDKIEYGKKEYDFGNSFIEEIETYGTNVSNKSL